MSYDVETVKQQASGQWSAIITSLCGISEDLLDSRHHPCPVCGGTDRFRAFDDFSETGGIHCNQCEPKADGFAVVAWLNGIEFIEALGQVAKFLRMEPTGKRNRSPGSFRQKPPGKRKKQTKQKQPAKKKPLVTPLGWNLNVVASFLRRNPDWTEQQLQACGAIVAEYRDDLVMAFPIQLHDDVYGYMLFPAMQDKIQYRDELLSKLTVKV